MPKTWVYMQIMNYPGCGPHKTFSRFGEQFFGESFQMKKFRHFGEQSCREFVSDLGTTCVLQSVVLS